jgi:hypothetical protein
MMSFPEPGCARNLTNLIKINYEVDARVIIHEMYPVPSLGRAQSAFGCGRFANARREKKRPVIGSREANIIPAPF